MKTVGEAYKEIKALLTGTGEAEVEAKHILAHVLGCKIAALYLRFSDPLEKEAEAAAIVQKRLSGMPLAYALREKQFYGYDFYVDENVLVPRADTECVVERALLLAKERGCQTALDLCCGSGCIGITLAKEAGLAVTLADLSEGALMVARQNARQIAPECAFTFVQGDLFENIDGQFDLIVCNPPYIGAAEYRELEPQVREFEPRSALLAEKDGYAFYERLAREAGGYLPPGGALVLEIGCSQAQKVRGLLSGAGFGNIEVFCDLAGRERGVSSIHNSQCITMHNKGIACGDE